jgi:hypothetical protein
MPMKFLQTPINTATQHKMFSAVSKQSNNSSGGGVQNGGFMGFNSLPFLTKFFKSYSENTSINDDNCNQKKIELGNLKKYCSIPEEVIKGTKMLFGNLICVLVNSIIIDTETDKQKVKKEVATLNNESSEIRTFFNIVWYYKTDNPSMLDKFKKLFVSDDNSSDDNSSNRYKICAKVQETKDDNRTNEAKQSGGTGIEVPIGIICTIVILALFLFIDYKRRRRSLFGGNINGGKDKAKKTYTSDKKSKKPNLLDKISVKQMKEVAKSYNLTGYGKLKRKELVIFLSSSLTTNQIKNEINKFSIKKIQTNNK